MSELEEAAEKEFPLLDTKWCRTGVCEEENLHLLGHRKSFIKGANYQAERMYSEEDLREAFRQSRQVFIYQKDMPPLFENFEEWFEQFKKK